VAVTGSKVHCDKHAHFKAARQVINKARHSQRSAAVEYEVTDVFGFALKGYYAQQLAHR
jgi:hypothetical protein